jgi:hypothetical protein
LTYRFIPLADTRIVLFGKSRPREGPLQAEEHPFVCDNRKSRTLLRDVIRDTAIGVVTWHWGDQNLKGRSILSLQIGRMHQRPSTDIHCVICMERGGVPAGACIAGRPSRWTGGTLSWQIKASAGRPYSDSSPRQSRWNWKQRKGCWRLGFSTGKGMIGPGFHDSVRAENTG